MHLSISTANNMKSTLIIFSFITMTLCGNAQQAESLSQLHDTLMKKEISSFALAGKNLGSLQNTAAVNLTAIPLSRCNDKFVVFEKGNLKYLDLLVSIDADHSGTVSKVKEVRLIFIKVLVTLPDSALAAITDPQFCTGFTKKNKPGSSTCKVFRSADRKRVYVYMLNGSGENRYEVTWVVESGKYFTRVLDKVKE